MNEKPHIAVLMGGWSPEREVSWYRARNAPMRCARWATASARLM